jgi:predicted lysophospholipase L1 biosynthesis ABC-type transport system permease subunit
MKLGLYWRYSTRSLIRGGQRTLLAIFCVAVGVMAIVSLQLVGNAIDGALTSNVRNGNGGDLSVRSDINPFTAKDLDTFKTAEGQGVITDYTAVSAHDTKASDANGQTQLFTMRAVNPAHFPLSGSPVFITPSDGSLASLLVNNGAVLTDTLQAELGAHNGDSLKLETSDGTTMQVTVVGIIKGTGFFRSAQALVSVDDFAAAPNTAGYPVSYTVIYANVPAHTDANAAAAKKVFEQDFPLANVTTTKDAIQNQQDNVQQIRYFLQIVGLLALLIGGVGIINTMQVLLRRRQTEIAMLKTAGYRRGDLYALFGLEAGLLGIVGGIIGAAAGIGAGLGVEKLVSQVFFITLPTGINVETVLSGVAIGFFTALIFGLIPIVQASQIRPLAVLRGLAEGSRGGGILLSIGLGILLVALFFALAFSIVRNLAVTIGAVVGTGIFLVVLSLIFTLLVVVISRLPVPERLHWWYALLIVVGLAISALITIAVPAFGILFLAISALGIVVLLLPRNAKANVKMALRNLGRQPGRTVTTMVALFIGVFAIGLILVLGQNIKDKINNALASNLQYNTVVIANAGNNAAVKQKLSQISFIQGEQVNTAAQTVPVSVNGVPIQNVVPRGSGSGQSQVGRQEALAYLSFAYGYDLAGGTVPDVKIVQGAQDTVPGRNLGRADIGTSNVIMPQRASLAPLKLKLGDTITLAAQISKKPLTVKVVGFYTAGLSLSGGTMYSDNSVALTLANNKPLYIYQLKVPADKSQAVLGQVQAVAPTAQTFSVAELTLVVNSLLNDLIIMLTAIASLAMIAGIIIIANAVALAMLERRREIGILKSVGYTSRSVLGGVLVENGAIGFIGALLAMLLVTLALTVLGKLVFNTDFGFGIPVVLGMVLATAAVCMLIAALVAWSATRVRPLEVLRYE